MSRALVGLHARNDPGTFSDVDFEVLRIAKIELLKTMTLNNDETYIRARQVNPEMQFIVRIYDEGISVQGHPTPDAFVAKAVPRLKQLLKWTNRFEIHNEPNLANRKEGWGKEIADAANFRDWYLAVLQKLRAAVPGGKFGFPGLALDTLTDLQWLEVCRPAVNASDWLGVHCYWQYDHMTDPTWGLRFRHYHDRFPNKTLAITEFGDATPVPPSEEEKKSRIQKIAGEYRDYYTLLQRYPYVHSASAFILSSPDSQWESFAWRQSNGVITPIPYEVAKVPRPQPLPWEAFWERAQVPKQVPLGGIAEAHLTIVNDGTEVWHQSGNYPVQIGYRWFKPGDGEVLAAKDIRTSLPDDVAPGQAVTLTAKFAVPGDPGQYILHWDLIREGNIWFADEGSQPLSRSVEVILTESSSRYFSETGHSVPQPFLAFYYHYGLSLTGYPLTDVLKENGAKVQYFQRLALQASGPMKVQVKAIGQELLEARRKIKDLMASSLEGTGVSIAPPSIVDKTEQLSRDEAAMKHRPLNAIKEIVVHHTAVSADIPLADIVAAHRKRWPGIVYQYYILADGTILQTEPLTETVSDEQAYLWKGVNIGLAGNFTLDVPPHPQLKATADLIAWLLSTLNLTQHDVYGLSELVSNSFLSPGYQWLLGGKYKERLLALVSERLQSAGDSGALKQVIAELQHQVASLKAKLAVAQKPSPLRPAIVDLVDQLPHHATKRYSTRPLSAITALAIHHSGSPKEFTPQAIAAYHVADPPQGRGWPGIGYHFYISSNGTIYQTNRLETTSYHVGNNNRYAVGICFNGEFNGQRLPTDAQLVAGGKLVVWLMDFLHMPEENMLGHKEFPGYMDSVDCTNCDAKGHCQSVAGHPRCTDCPGGQWKRGDRWYDMLLAKIHEAQGIS